MMYYPRLRGTHYDMGYHYGALLYKNGFRPAQLPSLSAEHGEFVRASEEIVEAFHPEILEEIRGFSDGCKGSYEHLLGFLSTIGVTQRAPHCSCFAAITNEGVLFGRNHDYFTATKQFTESSLVVPRGFNTFVGHSDVFIGKEDGVNAEGLAVGYTFVYGQTSQPGMNFLLAVRGILETCASVGEAVDWLEALPLSTYQNFVLADASGALAVVEASPERKEVRYPEEGKTFIVATNNFQRLSMRTLQQNEDRNWYEAETRFAGITQILAKKQHALTVADCQEILAGKYGFVCQYPRRGDFDTLWSVVVNLNTLALTRAEGNPSRAKFKADPRISKAR